MNRQVGLRVIFIAILMTSAGLIVSDYASGQSRGNFSGAVESDVVETIDTSQSSYQPENLTIISSVKVDLASASEKGALLAVTPAGRIMYEDRSYNIYDDVDPSPAGQYTVSYVSAIVLDGEDCSQFESKKCTLNFIERVNLTSGEKTRLYSAKTAQVGNSRWHDADRIDAHRFLIADIAHDRVTVVNTTTGEMEWAWNMSDEFDPESSGWDDPNDWAHVNDVELLEDGRIMVSPRNHDQVLFLSQNGTLVDNWTIGSDNDHGKLYEQHNPDYLTDGPRDSVLIADSQNNRIVEYARTDAGGWDRTWTWTDSELQWPRDADRLPNGHTLIADTSGKRVIEIDQNGELIWGVRVDGNYEAERLGTGDESQNGPTAESAGLDTTGGGSENLLPPQIRNGALYVLPGWGSVRSIVGVVLALVGIVGLTSAEAWWRLRPHF